MRTADAVVGGGADKAFLPVAGVVGRLTLPRETGNHPLLARVW